MFASITMTAVLSTLLLAARADPTPDTPGPGDSYNAGSTCSTTWVGDANSTTAWKTMAIELMTGSNLAMTHLTTLTTTADGTADGTYTYTCPEVTINAPIYFYQFTSPDSSDVTWTTRFTIASDSGAAVAAPNATQPSGDAIPWGEGALSDPSTAVAAPVFTSASGSTGTTAVVAATTTSTGTTAAVVASAASGSSSSSRLVSSASGSAASSASASGSSSAAAASGTAGSAAAANAAAGTLIVDARVWQAGVALGASALAFTIFL